MIAIEEFKSGLITKRELRRLLGFETRGGLDGFLKARGVFEEYTLDDLEQEWRDISRLGYAGCGRYGGRLVWIRRFTTRGSGVSNWSQRFAAMPETSGIGNL